MTALAISVPADDSSGFTLAELRAATVARIDAHADAINALLLLLDMIDGDPEAEPNLGSPERRPQQPFWPEYHRTRDGDQTHWADGSLRIGNDDAEDVQNEDGYSVRRLGNQGSFETIMGKVLAE